MHGLNRTLPVVLWHGMGDSCCAPWSIGSIKTVIEEKLGVYVHSIATGSSSSRDVLSSYFGNVNDQVTAACEQLRAIPELANGYNAVGFSQGGQFLRAVVQRCQHSLPRMHTLITMGGQHQGIMNTPGCLNDDGSHSSDDVLRWLYRLVQSTTCRLMQKLLSGGAYLPGIRDHVVQAQYFKDPYHLDQYLALNPFLPDINNERAVKTQRYADNLASLKKLVLVRFTEDATVIPPESAWFGFFNGSHTLTMKQQPIYTQDWIGLKTLDQAGRLLFEECEGQHMQFSLKWFEENIINRHLI